MRILHVEQEVASDDTSILESILSADTYRSMLLDREVALSNELSNYAKVFEISDSSSTKLLPQPHSSLRSHH